jgi:hypothetical protein
MENVINRLPSLVSDAAMNAKPAEGLKVGRLNHGLTLFETFGNEEIEQTKVQALEQLATVEFLTCEDFKKACKGALEMADAADAATGFVPKTNAKGTEKYGPKRRVLNQRLSEAKQLFGVFRLNADVLRERGYWSALSIAREYLTEAQVKWDNTRIVDAEEKAAKADSKAQRSALDEVMSMHAQKPGESIRDYMERMADKVDTAIATKQQEAFNAEVNKLVKSLIDKQDGETLVLACLRIIEQIGDIPDAVEYLNEAKMLEQADVLKQAENQPE